MTYSLEYHERSSTGYGKIVQRHDGALSEDEWRKFFDAAIAGTEMDLSAASKDDMKDDEHTIIGAFLGAPLVAIEKVTTGNEVIKAV